MKVLSLGWGVQTWTLAAMAAKGAIPKPDVAIHADTTFEREATYGFAPKWTEWLREHGVNVVTVRPERPSVWRLLGEAGSVITQGKRKGQARDQAEFEVKIPAYTIPATPHGKPGQIRRQCTGDWKVAPIRRRVRELLPHGETAIMQIGISKDEFLRAKDADVSYIRNEFPLLYDAPMSRRDCIDWLISEKLPIAPKSSCAFCPYHKERSWGAMRAEGGRDQALSLRVDQQIRDKRPPAVYLWDKRRPLADLRIPEDFGCSQTAMFEFEDFGDGRCDEGVCWV